MFSLCSFFFFVCSFGVSFFGVYFGGSSRYPVLTHQQWKSIRYILQHPETTPELRSKVKQILYHKYENLAIHRAFVFRRFHSHKCRNVCTDDLILSAKLGLFHCVRNYRGKTPFYPYLRTYLQGELYRGLTDFFPITAISKKERKTNKDNLRFSTDWKKRLEYRKKLNTHFLDFENFWQIDKMPSMQNRKSVYDEKEKVLDYFVEYQRWIRSLNAREQVLIQLKYSLDLERIRTNREIADRLNISEEAVRKAVARIRMKWWRTFLEDFAKRKYEVLSSSV